MVSAARLSKLTTTVQVEYRFLLAIITTFHQTLRTCRLRSMNMNVSTSSLCRLQGFGHRYPVNCVLKAKHTSTFTFGPKTTEAYNRRKKSTLQSNELKPAPTKPQISLFERAFWTCRGTWKRAGINTFRCLVGCTVGDFSALWALQTYAPELGMGTIMGLSSKL